MLRINHREPKSSLAQETGSVALFREENAVEKGAMRQQLKGSARQLNTSVQVVFSKAKLSEPIQSPQKAVHSIPAENFPQSAEGLPAPHCDLCWVSSSSTVSGGFRVCCGEKGLGVQLIHQLPGRVSSVCTESVFRDWVRASSLDIAWLIELHGRVRKSGLYNYQNVRQKVPSTLNMQFLRGQLSDYSDQIICEFLEFGWPVGYKSEELPVSRLQNHKGAQQFPEAMDRYISKEVSLGATLGPFSKNPLQVPVAISQLNSVPKKGGLERRVILDLSFPAGSSVNDGISKIEYLGEEIGLMYPNVDNLADLIRQKGQGCHLYKRNLRRAYRQFPVDPGDIHLLGFSWRGKLFLDRMLAMGLRSAAMMCHSLLTA